MGAESEGRGRTSPSQEEAHVGVALLPSVHACFYNTLTPALRLVFKITGSRGEGGWGVIIHFKNKQKNAPKTLFISCPDRNQNSRWRCSGTREFPRNRRSPPSKSPTTLSSSQVCRNSDRRAPRIARRFIVFCFAPAPVFSQALPCTPHISVPASTSTSRPSRKSFAPFFFDF